MYSSEMIVKTLKNLALSTSKWRSGGETGAEFRTQILQPQLHEDQRESREFTDTASSSLLTTYTLKTSL